MDVLFELTYGASVAASRADPLKEAADAYANVVINTLCDGFLANVLLDANYDSQSLFETVTFQMTIDPGLFDRLTIDIQSEGLANNQLEPTVPVPATLVLLGLGFVGIGYRRRWII